MADDRSRQSRNNLWMETLQAIIWGEVQTFSSLLEKCPDNEVWAGHLLKNALKFDRREMLELLVPKLQTGVISLNGDPERPLERVLVKAIRWNSKLLVKELVSLGVDLNAANFDVSLLVSPEDKKRNLAFIKRRNSFPFVLRGMKLEVNKKEILESLMRNCALIDYDPPIERRTLLAFVLRDMEPRGNKKEMVELLLDLGADLSCLVSDDEFPEEYDVDDEILQLLRRRYLLSLRHLAAFTIARCHVQYQGQVPDLVAAYIRGHRSRQQRATGGLF